MEYRSNSNYFILRRGIAYIIDIIFISIISILIARINIINPTKDQYLSAYQEYEETINDAEDIRELVQSEKMSDLVYAISKYGRVYTFINAAVLVMYFAVFQKATGGQTLGKRFLKIKVVNKDGEKVRVWSLLLRSLFLYDIISNVSGGIAIGLMNKADYITFNSIVNIVFKMISYATIIVLVFRQDGKGLHDLIAGTKVVDLKKINTDNVVLEKEIDLKKQKDGSVIAAEYEESQKPTIKKKSNIKKPKTKKQNKSN